MFFNNYAKPGKGVNKRDPNQPRIQVFFEVLPRKLWDIIKLNLLYLVASLPFFVVTLVVAGVVSSSFVDGLSAQLATDELVYTDVLIRVVVAFWFMIFLGMGPTTAAYSYVMREHGREKPCWMFSDFFERFRKNFKQGFLVWIIDLAVFYLLSVACRFYAMQGLPVLSYVVIVIGVVCVLSHVYLYPMLVTYELSLGGILKNSLIMALGKAPVSLLLVLLNVLLFVAVPVILVMTAKSLIVFVIALLVLVLVLLPAATFTTIFCVDPILEKYINIQNQPENQK